MSKIIAILLICLIFSFPEKCYSQDSLSLKAQLSAWTLYNGGNELPLYFGVRYIPQVNYDIKFKSDNHLDFEVSANINGSGGINPFSRVNSNGQIKPYRLWARYSTQQFELRAGLQKINFGSASILRPLMWFDQVDPRDPLKLTDGVWGILGRYYFLDNINIWLWGLYGNDKPRGWEPVETNKSLPELGGRFQLPVPAGEAAFSYNYRTADSRELGGLLPAYAEIPESKFGFDIKLDLIVGCWLEGSWVSKNKELGLFTNQEILNTGADYTFGIGNGLYMIFEQILAANDEKPFKFQNTNSFSLLSVSYPVSLFDNIRGIIYYDWRNSNSYNFLNWEKQFKKISLYLMAYWNPEQYKIPSQGNGQNLFAGKGIQIMLVLNH